MNILVLAAHPDDEVLGCGGSIYKHYKNGDNITVIFVSDGYMEDYSNEVFRSKKRKHAQESCDILGVNKVIFLGYEGARLEMISKAKINLHIESILRK